MMGGLRVGMCEGVRGEAGFEGYEARRSEERFEIVNMACFLDGHSPSTYLILQP